MKIKTMFLNFKLHDVRKKNIIIRFLILAHAISSFFRNILFFSVLLIKKLNA